MSSDSGFIIAGYTYSFGSGNSDVFLIKTDNKGDTIWTKTFGGSQPDYGYSVQQTSDNGYIIAGYTYSFGTGNRDVYLIKTDSNGDVQWTKTYGGVNSDCGYSVQQTLDDGFIIAGYTYSFGVGNSDVYLIKTDANGDTLWTKTYGGTSNDLGYSVQQTDDRRYIIVGYTYSFGTGGADVYFIRTDEDGNTLWTKTYGGSYNDEGNAVQQTSDGGYIISGTVGLADGVDQDIYLIKTDINGDTIWTKTFGGFSSDIGYAIQETHASCYVVAGKISRASSGCDVYLLKTDAEGDSLWARSFGDEDNDVAYSIQETPDSGFVITGVTSSFGSGGTDVYLLKTVPYHNPTPEIWINPSSFEFTLDAGDSTSRLLTIGNSGDDNLIWYLDEEPSVNWFYADSLCGLMLPGDSMNVTIVIDSTYLMSGYHFTTIVITSNDTSDPELNIPVKLTIIGAEDTISSLYPNPFVPKRGYTSINYVNLPNQGTIELYAINGDLVWKHDLNQSGETYSWDVKVDGKDVTTGVYVYIIKNGIGKVVKKAKLAIIR